MIKINEYFANAYLTAGQTRDNFIFENCPLEFMHEAKRLLSSGSEEFKSCILEIDENCNSAINSTLQLFQNELHKKIIARDYICSKILSKLLILTNGNQDVINELIAGITTIETGDRSQIEQYHKLAPMAYDITSFFREIKKFELNFMIFGNSNIYLQEAINNFISSREPYSVKVFSTQKLSTLYDQTKNFIENPHDYMKRNVQDFIEILNEKE